ncbi:hypothetical protein [Falsirhodobacter sp. 20TX0035]|nr:hypothetical protein [Falsirhodobacter sp. 20TX0035]MDB6452840.1 hypothetical protein [Falsirhodobacter sp. 20TX0035]
MAAYDPRDPLSPTPRWRGALQRAAFIVMGSALLFAYGAFTH